MQDAHAAQSNQNGVVNEVHHGVNGLVATHAPDVQILMKVLTTVFHRSSRHMRRLNSQMGVLISGGSKFFTIHFYFFTSFQLLQLDLASQSSEDDRHLLALNGFYLADAVRAFDANGVALR